MAAASTIAIASLAATVISTGMSVMGQMQAGKAAKSQAAYQAGVMRNNEILAQRAAKDARARGDIAAAKHAADVKKLQGRQRAVLAGNGVVVDQDSALDIVSDTAAQGKHDELTIRSNAEREALGFEAQGANFQAEGALATARGANASQAAMFGAGGSLISGAGSVASKWYDYKKDFSGGDSFSNSSYANYAGSGFGTAGFDGAL